MNFQIRYGSTANPQHWSVTATFKEFSNKKANQCITFLQRLDTPPLLAMACFTTEPTDLLSAVLQSTDESGSSLCELASEEASN